MESKKGGRGQQRASVPDVYRIEMGRRMKQLAEKATHERSAAARANGIRRPATLTALHSELYAQSGIPPALMQQYQSGIRTPSIMDLRAIASFLGTTMEHLMQDVPPYSPPQSGKPQR